MITGSCLCRAVRYECSDPTHSVNCHCSRCRKSNGAAFATVLRVPLASFRIVAGEGSLARYESSPGCERTFCKVCGSNLFSLRSALGRVHVRLGTVDGDPGVRPTAHVFVGSKAPWYEITDELPQHEEGLPPT
jgi:hypothetical protein